MRIERLQLTNFRSYQEADIDLSGIHLASVVGPNGSGKSSLLEALVFALTGGTGGRKMDTVIRTGQEECRVQLTFAMGPDRYRITRTRSNRNSGKSTAELVRQEGDGWVAEGAGARELDTRIQQVLGVDEGTLLRTSIVPQGGADSFFALKPAERLEALGKILRLDERYLPLEKHFKTKADATKLALEKTRGEIERLEIDAEALVDREALAHVAREALGNRRTAQEQSEQDLAEAQERARVAQDGVRDAEEAQRRLGQLTARRSELSARRNSLTAELDRALLRGKEKPALEAAIMDRGGLEGGLAALAQADKADQEIRARRGVLEADLRAAKQARQQTDDQARPQKAELVKALITHTDAGKRITDIESADTPVCDRCGQEIEDTALEKTLDQLRLEFSDAAERVGKLQESLNNLIRQSTAQTETVATLEAQIADLPWPIDKLPEQRRLQDHLDSLKEIPAKLAAIAQIEKRADDARAELQGVNHQLQDPTFGRDLQLAQNAVDAAAERTRAATEASLDAGICAEQLTAARQEVSALEQTVARHEEGVRLLLPSVEKLSKSQAYSKQLEQDLADLLLLGGTKGAFSKWGIPALIIGDVLQALEGEVNNLLDLFDDDLAVRFESERPTNAGPRDSLEIMVRKDGEWRIFETFSGGEKYRVAITMRLGLALLLANRSGARVETLIVDEPEGLDIKGRQDLARILERMSEHFGVVLLLTHYADLQEALPSQILVSRGDDGFSQVEVAA